MQETGTTYLARARTLETTIPLVTDEPTEPNDIDRETSDSDGEVEIEVTRGRDERFDDAPGSLSDRRHDRETTHDRLEGNASESVSDGALADELGRIDIMTTPEGYVEGRIIDVAGVDSTTVELTVSLPHGETASFPLEKPIPWSREFLLARLVEDIGYDAASIDHIVGEPVYVQRTDLEANDEEWWAWESSLQTASDALLSSLSGGRYRLEREQTPEWRLVDPLERPEPKAEPDSTLVTDERLGIAFVLVGTLVAAIGGVLGATGTLVVSASVLGALALGLAIVLVGLAIGTRDSS
ncbi:hypothetical protein SAMN04487967_1206 [Natronorubrum sediminis]|uniref:Uncharacterized protein n=1 Tax=Natronorubrum sediminis TaxID=640943 RepID=A0A1H6FSG8_9EURY|nr:hypothetical protein [Natronorubrum sediminis]SEH13190.1 hypothetical protein SAMN04487967_1206 [Natronorubrum sediminis]